MKPIKNKLYCRDNILDAEFVGKNAFVSFENFWLVVE